MMFMSVRLEQQREGLTGFRLSNSSLISQQQVKEMRDERSKMKMTPNDSCDEKWLFYGEDLPYE